MSGQASKKGGGNDRFAKRAAALRKNLKKRKTQTHARTGDQKEEKKEQNEKPS